MDQDKQEEITVEANYVVLNNFRIASEELVAELVDAEDRREKLLGLIDLGLRARNLADNRVDEDSVKFTVQKLGEKFEKQIEEAVQAIDDKSREMLGGEESEAGKIFKGFRQELQKELAENFDAERANSFMSKFNALLDKTISAEFQNFRREFEATNPDSSLGKLSGALKQNLEDAHKALKAEIDAVKELVTTKSADKKALGKQSKKGTELESAIHEALAPNCTKQRDVIKVTGAETGFAGNMKGDLVIELDTADSKSRNLKIVIESKAASKTTTAIRDEIMLGMENRRASVGIAVFDINNIPTGITEHFTPFENFCVVIVDREDVDSNLLYVAYLWARWNVLKQRLGKELTIPVSQIDDLLNKIQDRMKLIVEIKKGHGAMNRALRLANGNLETLETNLTNEIEEFRLNIGQDQNDEDYSSEMRQEDEAALKEYEEETYQAVKVLPMTGRDFQMAGNEKFGDQFPQMKGNLDTQWINIFNAPSREKIREYLHLQDPTLDDLSKKFIGDISEMTGIGEASMQELFTYIRNSDAA